MLYLLKPAALGAVLCMTVLTSSSAPASAQETGLSGNVQALGKHVNPPERSTESDPSLPDDTPVVEGLSRAPRWIIFDFVTSIKTVEFADGSLHEELFEPEPLVQMVLSTVPSVVPPDAVVTGSVHHAPR
jgi:hypothetical protein